MKSLFGGGSRQAGRQPYFGLRGNALNTATIILVVCPALTCYGYNQAVAGGILTLPSFDHQFPRMDTVFTTGATQHYNSLIQGTVIALYTVGGIFGALACIVLGDHLGRRTTIFASMCLSMIGAILMCTSFSMGQFIVARLVLGFGTGGYTATVPVWQSEISTSKHRGAHVVTEGIFIGSGIVIALWVDFGLYFVTWSSVSWRFPLALQIVLSLIVMGFIYTLPESPRWLVSKDRTAEARQIFAILADTDPEDERVTHAINEVHQSLAIVGKGSWFDVLKMGKQRWLHRCWLGATCQMFQQMCGINLITFYATTIFQSDLGMNATDSRILAASMEIMQPIGAFVAFFTIDRFGRRNLMIFSAAGMMCCMAILAGTTSRPDNTQALVAAIVFLFVFNFLFPIGFLGIPFLYAAEVAPLHLRAIISGIAVSTTWCFNFLVAEITPVGFNTIQYRYYIIYACINAAMVPTVYFFFPETTGLTLEGMDEVFERSTNMFAPPRIAAQMKRERQQRTEDDLQESTKGEYVQHVQNGLQGPPVDSEGDKTR